MKRTESRLALNITAIDSLKQVVEVSDVKGTKLDKTVAVLALSLANVGNLKQAVQASDCDILELDQIFTDVDRSRLMVVDNKELLECADTNADFSYESSVSGGHTPPVGGSSQGSNEASQTSPLASQSSAGGSPQIFGAKSKHKRRGRKHHKIHHKGRQDQAHSAFDAAMQKNKSSAKITTALLEKMLPLSPAIARIATNKMRSSYSASIVLVVV